MPGHKWLAIARSEYLTITSGIRKWRRWFPHVIIAFILIYLVWLMPLVVDFALDDFTEFFIGQAALAMMELMLFMFFVWFMIIPITTALRDEKTGQQELLLSAPIKPSDILLGKFVGQLPFYSIGVAFVGGFFTAVLAGIGIDAIQITLTILTNRVIIACYYISPIGGLLHCTSPIVIISTKTAKPFLITSCICFQ